MHRITLILLCLLYCFSASGQYVDSILASKEPDTVKATFLSNYAFNISESKPDSALILAKESLRLSERSNSKIIYAHCFNTIGWVYFILGKNDSAKSYLSKAEVLFSEVHNKKGEARALINLSAVHHSEQDYQAALNKLLTAMKLLGSSDELEYGVAEKMIGTIYRKQGLYTEAKRYLKNAAADFLLLKKEKYYADASGSLGGLYYDTNNPDSAALYYHIALDIYLKIKNKSGAALSYENLGMVSLLKSKGTNQLWLDSALHYYQRAYSLFDELNNPLDIAFEKINISEVLIKKKQYALAEKNLLEALQTFKSQHVLSNIYACLATLSNLYSETKDYHKAYDFQIQAKAYNDTLNVQNKNTAIADMLTKYEADKKDRTIALLNTQNALLNTKKQLAEHTLYRTRIIEIFVLVLILFSVFLGFVLLNRYRIKQRLHELQIRNRISNDLHDDVGSSLSSIFLLSKIATKDTADKQELLNKISTNAADVIERISDIVWTTSPKYDDGDNLRAKIMNYLAPLCQAQGISLNINISEAIKDVKFPMETRKNIFLIIKEAVNNTMKYSKATEINFSMAVKEKNIVFEIKDNGKGFDAHDQKSGNGLATMQSRADLLKGKITIESAADRGTNIIVTMPMPRSIYFPTKKQAAI